MKVIKMEKYKSLQYFIIDVDGTLTDSGIYYSDNVYGLKRFSTKDKIGIMAAKYINIKTVVVTGRSSLANKTRLNEMGVDYIFQEVKNKREFLQKFIDEHQLSKDSIGYIGDDLNDFGAMKLAGFVACPNDSSEDILALANYVAHVNGGYGVIQDVFRHVLKELGRWDEFLSYISEVGF